MILFHGTNTEITEIDLQKCRPYKDFGRGFYLTPILEQATRMAYRVARIYGGNPRVCTFDVDETRLSALRVCRFDAPSEMWARFVINNRNRFFNPAEDDNSNHDNKYDVVIGPVANDDLALLFRQFSSGYISNDTLVHEMTFKKLTFQVSFHTDKAIPLLRKVGSENV